jgi:hypothetical protein
MKHPSQKPLTGPDREKYVQAIRSNEGRITHRVHKSTYGQNDIFGIDVISYSPYDIIMDQTTTTGHMSDRAKKIEYMLKEPPEVVEIKVYVHGIDGYKLKDEIHITRHIIYEWLDDGTWEKEVIIDSKKKSK